MYTWEVLRLLLEDKSKVFRSTLDSSRPEDRRLIYAGNNGDIILENDSFLYTHDTWEEV